MASVTSRSSSIRLILAGFHNTTDMALHPFLEASWTLISRQYHFLELILLWFHGVVLPSSSMWTCDESKHLWSDTPSIKAMSMQSTSASLLGVNETPSALSSFWLGWQCLSSDHSEPWFELTEGHFFSILFLLLWLFLLDIVAFEILCFTSTAHLLNSTKQ